jgi:hypothetical protein
LCWTLLCNCFLVFFKCIYFKIIMTNMICVPFGWTYLVSSCWQYIGPSPGLEHGDDTYSCFHFKSPFRMAQVEQNYVTH